MSNSINEEKRFSILKYNLEERLRQWGDDINDSDVTDFAEYDLAEEINDSKEFFLYRYTPAGYFNIRNIETQMIHLSTNGVMNDIYEGLPVIQEFERDLVEKLDDLVVMTCFSETNDNQLMWSHYADSHKGFCIQYDLKRLENDPFETRKHLFPVIYQDKRYISRNIESLVESHDELKKAINENVVFSGYEGLDDILPLFITKGKAWEYEDEWRIVYTKKQLYDINSNQLYGGNIDFNCISAVYLGYRIHPEIRKNLLEICDRISTDDKPVDVYQARLDPEGYNIMFDRIKEV